ncbi:uncharacterized protein BO80DRAFT_434774 [Aspergillus ibericus CBS 121593]|uniref:Fungal lipase-type domain-containing protein n=1 Tax=Aspergillus ibericus CBS 121593 TaxID=1448316 RepID=A0A395H0I9_9EURO|nr:hypothetical protein BO80DRAFT_434774 [Aspergillus ibericus CBS 121593]RAL01130.1 hypothetical protein BO80DRAFT_434774 [Aspergillus ibericus CBS 121593]
MQLGGGGKQTLGRNRASGYLYPAYRALPAPSPRPRAIDQLVNWWVGWYEVNLAYSAVFIEILLGETNWTEFRLQRHKAFAQWSLQFTPIQSPPRPAFSQPSQGNKPVWYMAEFFPLDSNHNTKTFSKQGMSSTEKTMRCTSPEKDPRPAFLSPQADSGKCPEEPTSCSVVCVFALQFWRIGNLALADYITDQDKGSNYRVTHTDDIVPKLPPELLGYHNFSPEYWITSGNYFLVPCPASF